MSPRLLLILLAAAVGAPSPAVASGAKKKPKSPPPNYRVEFRKVDTAWRLLLNDAEALAGETQSARGLCQQAKDTENNPDLQQYAHLYWQALDTVVKEDSFPILDDATARQGAALKQTRALRQTFSIAWKKNPKKLRPLTNGTSKVLSTNPAFTSGLSELQDAFIAWAAHDCTGGEQHAATATQQMKQAEAPLNAGMKLLKSLL